MNLATHEFLGCWCLIGCFCREEAEERWVTRACGGVVVGLNRLGGWVRFSDGPS